MFIYWNTSTVTVKRSHITDAYFSNFWLYCTLGVWHNNLSWGGRRPCKQLNIHISHTSQRMTQKYLSCAIILSARYDENAILSVWCAWCEYRRAPVNKKNRAEPLEQTNPTLLYTSLTFICLYIDDICRCNGFVVRLAAASCCELFHHCVFIQLVWHENADICVFLQLVLLITSSVQWNMYAPPNTL